MSNKFFVSLRPLKLHTLYQTYPVTIEGYMRIDENDRSKGIRIKICGRLPLPDFTNKIKAIIIKQIIFNNHPDYPGPRYNSDHTGLFHKDTYQVNSLCHFLHLSYFY